MIYLIAIPNIKLYNVICQNYVKRTGKAQYVKMTEAFRKIYLYHQALYKERDDGNIFYEKVHSF